MKHEHIWAVVGVVAAVGTALYLYNQQDASTAKAVTSKDTGGLKTTPVQANRIAFAAEKFVSGSVSGAKKAVQSALSLVIPARTNALQPNGNPASNNAAYKSPVLALYKTSSYANIK